MFTIKERLEYSSSTFLSVLLSYIFCEIWEETIHPNNKSAVLRGFAALVSIIGHDLTMNRTLRNVRTMIQDLCFTAAALQVTVHAQSMALVLVWTFCIIVVMSIAQHSIGLKLSMSVVPLVLQARMFTGTGGGQAMLITLLVSAVSGMIAATITSLGSTPKTWLHRALKCLEGVSKSVAEQLEILTKVLGTYPREGSLQLRLLDARSKFWMSRLEFLQPHCANTPFNRIAMDMSDKMQVAQRTCSLLTCAEAGMQQVLAEDVIFMQAEVRHMFNHDIGASLKQLSRRVSYKLLMVMDEITSNETAKLSGTRSLGARAAQNTASKGVRVAMKDLAIIYKDVREKIYFDPTRRNQLIWQDLLPLNAYLFFLNYISALVLTLDTIVEKQSADPLVPPVGRFWNVISQYVIHKFDKLKRRVTYVTHPSEWKWAEIQPKIRLSVKICLVWATSYLIDWLLLSSGTPRPSVVAFTTAYLLGSPNRSGTIDTGVQRFIGTVISMTVVAILTNVSVLKHEQHAAVAMALVIIFFSGWLRSHPKLAHAGTVAAFTTAAAVLDGQHPLRRIEQTVIGIVIMTVGELLISPSVSKQSCINQYRYTLALIKESQLKVLAKLDAIDHEHARRDDVTVVTPSASGSTLALTVTSQSQALGQVVIPIEDSPVPDLVDPMVSELESFITAADLLVEGGKSSAVYEQVATSCAKLDRLLDQAESDLFWEGIFGSPKVPGEFDQLTITRRSMRRPPKPGTPFDGNVYRKIHGALRICGIFSQSLEAAMACLVQAHLSDKSHSRMSNLFYALKGPFREGVAETSEALDKLCKLVEWLNDRPLHATRQALPKELRIFVGPPIRLESSVLIAEVITRQLQINGAFGADRVGLDDTDARSWVGEDTRNFMFKYRELCEKLQSTLFNSGKPQQNGTFEGPTNLELQAFNALIFCQSKLLAVTASLISHTQDLLIHAYSAEEK